METHIKNFLYQLCYSVCMKCIFYTEFFFTICTCLVRELYGGFFKGGGKIVLLFFGHFVRNGSLSHLVKNTN